MKIEQVVLRQITLPLKKPFTTHQGAVEKRKLIIVEVFDPSGIRGYGEVTAFDRPFYTSETIDTAWHILTDFLIPRLFSSKVQHPRDVSELVGDIQGHPMAKAGLEGALWDLYGKQTDQSLKTLIGGTRDYVKAGAVLSLSASLEEDINHLKTEGYERFKLKVKKGEEKALIEDVQRIDPGLPLMIDANGQYSEKDMAYLKSLDEYKLLMIEQPFRPGDFYLHQKFQSSIQTPVSLDESIMNADDAVQAVELNSCKTVNIKISRVGGMKAAVSIHDYCLSRNIPVWCGGMVESGISKAHNLAMASLENFSIPGDLSGSTRYFERDIVSPGIEMKAGRIEVPDQPGIGIDVDLEYLEYVTEHKLVLTP
ncbi:o-succinylbenzoate synthase [Halobacillus fulvus]|nr:o-succinylbenzoate synthase [Halobacillus fulvus]